MSAQDFQLIDTEKIEVSFIKRDFIKVYHQSGANVDAEKSQTKVYIGENQNCFKAGDGYLEFHKRIRLVNDSKFVDGNVIRLVNNAFAYTIQDDRISTSAGVEIEQKKYVGPISTIMRLVTQRDGDLSTSFDIIDESEN